MQQAYVLNVLEQLRAFRTHKEGGNGMLTLRIQLCGEDTQIRFTERHIVNLHELLKVAATPVSADIALSA